MVSHLDPPNQLVPHRPPSVTSRASTSRRHRHNRSHHGGSSYATQNLNEFPVFSHTGDVEIVITSLNGRKQHRYLLHRLILSQCSGFFEAGTRQEWSGAGAQRTATAAVPTTPQRGLPRITEHESTNIDLPRRRPSSEQDRKRWRYVLDWGNSNDDDVPMLVQRDPSSSHPAAPETPGPPPVTRNKPPTSSTSFFRSMSDFSALNLNSSQPSQPPDPDDELLRDYDNLFRIMYNYPPALDNINIANAYTECKALIHLAGIYDALEVVGPRIDHHLLRFQGRLFKQIAKYPPSYLKLGFLARSKGIFAEALIHVVGQWPVPAPQLRGQIDDSVLDLIEDKVDELEEIKAKVEAKLFRLTLTTSRGERVTPSNSFLDWLAMSLFRQWVAENTTPAPVSILKDTTSRQGSSHSTSTTAPTSSSALRPSHSRNGSSNPTSSSRSAPSAPAPPPPPSLTTGRIYRLLGSTSPSAYLPHDELKRFLKLSPELYTRENLRRFERRVDELKNLARDAVKPLTRNFLELDLSATTGGNGGASGGTVMVGGLGYLTCTRVGDGDFPWDD